MPLFAHLPTANPLKQKRQFAAVVSMVLLLAPLSLTGCADQESGGADTLTPNFNIGGNRSWQTLQAEIDQAKDGDTIDLTAYIYPMPNGIRVDVSVPEGLSIHLRGNPEWEYRNVSFAFAGDNTVVFEDISIAYHPTSGHPGRLPLSAIHFEGGDNSIELVGTNRIHMDIGDNLTGHGAAIGVPEGVSLTVSGSGSLMASTGIGGGAGIGGGYETCSGSITIAGGSITSSGGVAGVAGTQELQQGAAAIGGGYGGNGGTTAITGGSVTARGTNGSAAIGGGYGGAGGTITVSGGFVEAHTDGGGAALGGGYGASGGVVILEGGEVEAFGQEPGPAIGNGVGGNGGTFAMSGGRLAALASGQPSHPALQCKVLALPSAYSWQAGELADRASSPVNTFPETALADPGVYGYILIESH